jgi:hypothetical protein
MTETPQARPALLTINAVLSILIGAAGTLLFGYSLLGNRGLLLFLAGPMLIALTMMRWGLAVLANHPTMAYFPKRSARTGRYGAFTGWLIIILAAPALTLLLSYTHPWDQPYGWVDAFDLAYPFIFGSALINAFGMIAFASRIDRGSKA